MKTTDLFSRDLINWKKCITLYYPRPLTKIGQVAKPSQTPTQTKPVFLTLTQSQLWVLLWPDSRQYSKRTDQCKPINLSYHD